jgi:septum formation protein
MKTGFVYLASASPRRSELLQQMGVPFEVWAAGLDEGQLPGEPPADYVMRMACAKADRVWTDAAAEARPRPVLGADTVVVLDDTVFGKPAGEPQALRMLEALSGRTHMVLTCVAVREGDEIGTALSTSEVRFRATTAAERRAYCATSEPYDKAGGYGIQGLGAVFVEQLKGSYSAVVGLPLFETAGLLKRFGLPAWLDTGPDRQ